MNKAINLVDENSNLTKNILILVWPVFLEQVLTTLISYADTAMVGSLGANATAAVTISNSVIFMLNGVISGLGTGITAFVSRAVGENNAEQVKKVIRHAIFAIVVLGLPICVINIALHRMIPFWLGADPEILDDAAAYNLITAFGRIFMLSGLVLNGAFRGYGDTKTPLKVNMTMNLVNLVFNYFLIYPTRTVTFFGTSFTMPGAGLGVTGAAIATAFGMFCSAMYAFRVATSRKNIYGIELKDCFKIDKSLWRRIISVSFPTMMERVFMSSAGIFVTSSVALLGTVSVAANSLSITAESLSYMPGFAFGIAVTTLVGQSLGANKPDLAVRYIRRTLLLANVVMVIAGVGLFIFADPIISIFTPDERVIVLAGNCLRILAFIQPIQASAWIYSGVLRGSGDTKSIFYINAATNWLIRTLGSVIAIRFFGGTVYSAQIFLCIEITVRLACVYLRYKGGKWQKYKIAG